MSDPLLQIGNHHTANCGDPPIIRDDDPQLYIGYFENTFGEQWIFTFNRKSREAKLRGGDVGWNTVHAVVNGKADGLVLAVDEALWLHACWQAAAGRS